LAAGARDRLTGRLVLHARCTGTGVAVDFVCAASSAVHVGVTPHAPVASGWPIVQPNKRRKELDMFTKMLVATDGSQLSIDAALRAIPLAKKAGASAVVIFVQDTYPYAGIGEANVVGMQDYIGAVRAEGTRGIDQVRAAAQEAGVSVETLVVEDHLPARGIVDAAANCGADLIVMGSHGRSGIAKLMLGSVAAKVLALSPVPVLVIK
jgi:nucleotide-binding universal stress UspA family protein